MKRPQGLVRIVFAGLILGTGCTLSPPPQKQAQSPRPPSRPMRPPIQAQNPSLPRPATPLLATALPRPSAPVAVRFRSASELEAQLWEAERLLERAREQVVTSRPAEAIILLQQALRLLDTDPIAEAVLPGALRREALRLEIAALLTLLNLPNGQEGGPEEGPQPEDSVQPSLVSPEDLEVLELARPRLFPPRPTRRAEPKVVYDVPIERNDQVEAYIELLTTTKREVTQEALERSGRYLGMMRQIFEEEGLPLDLVNLAYIESGFKVRAYSRARAVGIWQFIRSTGRRYGLRINRWIDERRDPEKATRAAARYLKDLYELFDSWPLAIAGYNAGEGRVLRAIARRKTHDFWRLKLPRETRLFVPAFMAMTIIAKDLERYGFSPPTINPVIVNHVTVPQSTDLRLVAKAARTSTAEIRDLNPELRRLITPPNRRYTIKVPYGRGARIKTALAKASRTRQITWQPHRVRRGETLSAIARRYRTTVRTLVRMNNLRNPHYLKTGTSLLVPVRVLVLAKRGSSPRKSGRAKAIVYRVRPGDTLWQIARAFDVKTSDLKRWNRIRGSLIHPGLVLRIFSD
ncbi:MAG: LysM peptidoglycan-binding domain-containing protein [Candidatus Methylomirabilales bacterium]